MIINVCTKIICETGNSVFPQNPAARKQKDIQDTDMIAALSFLIPLYTVKIDYFTLLQYTSQG